MFGFGKKKKKRQAKEDLMSNGDLTDINKFNAWFCDDSKDPNIYANAGIFLRGDKLSGYHIEHYAHSLTDSLTLDEVCDLVQEHIEMFYDFESAIRKDWLNQRRNG